MLVETHSADLDIRTEDSYIAERDAFAGRILKAMAGTFDIFTMYLGDRLGLYRALARSGDTGLTPLELAARTETHPRYIREWLEQQAVTGILRVDNPAEEPEYRRFYLSPARAEVLTDTESLNYIAPMVRLLVGAAKPLDLLQRAFKEGGGVPFTAYGADLREGQAETNRASFLQLMGTEWLSAMPDVIDRLRSSVPAHVADVGCGAGWSSIGIAQAYPNAEVYGFDMDMPSIELARANIREYNVANRVQFSVRDIATAAGDNSLAGTFDLVTAFECVHDMSDPVGALQGMRTLAGSEGAVLVVDERVPDRFSPGEERPDSEFEWMMYGWSVLHCLPVGMADDPSAGTGTVMRPNTMRSYAKDAGFRDVEVLPVENAFFRFYRLRQ